MTELELQQIVDRIENNDILWCQTSLVEELILSTDYIEDTLWECEHYIDPETEEPVEIYEWWLVTPWLAEKLIAQGEVVFEFRHSWFWGRQCTGQSIQLDGILQKIALSLKE